MIRVIGITGMPGTKRVVNALAPRRAAEHLFETRFFDLLYAGDLSQMIDRNIFYFGNYSPAELTFLRNSAEVLSTALGKVNFYDIGANTGQHSIYLSRKVDQVHAFEPSRRVLDGFRRNIDINRLTNITIHALALGDADSKAQLGSGLPGNSGSRSLNWTLPGRQTETVTVRAANTYFEENGLPRIDLLKLDVEGHESKVLWSLRARLRQDRPIILLELIGERDKSGFASQAVLYPKHSLLSLREMRGRYVITPFDWNCECAIVLPSEHAHAFR